MSVVLIRNGNYVSIIRGKSKWTEMKLSPVIVPRTITARNNAITGDRGVHLPKSELLLRIGIPLWRYFQGICALIGQRKRTFTFSATCDISACLSDNAWITTSRFIPSRWLAILMIDSDRIPNAIRVRTFAFWSFFVVWLQSHWIIKLH